VCDQKHEQTTRGQRTRGGLEGSKVGGGVCPHLSTSKKGVEAGYHASSQTFLYPKEAKQARRDQNLIFSKSSRCGSYKVRPVEFIP
jgi:hypothetical protein